MLQIGLYTMNKTITYKAESKVFPDENLFKTIFSELRNK